MKAIKELYLGLCMSSVFRSLLDKPLFCHLDGYFSSNDKSEKIKSYASFVAEIYKNGGSLTDLVRRLVFEDENVYIKALTL